VSGSPGRAGRFTSMWKLLAAWFAMLLVAVANGALRDFTYGRRMDELTAHQLSTAIGVVLLAIVIRWYVSRHPPDSGRQAVSIGLAWMALTVAFEFLFFHYVGGRSWAELLADYDVLAGRVWIAVPAWVAVAPYLFFRLRRAGRAALRAK